MIVEKIFFLWIICKKTVDNSKNITEILQKAKIKQNYVKQKNRRNYKKHLDIYSKARV